jgi:predicted MFS family arabinose efflux permease
MMVADVGRALLLATLPLAWWMGWLTFAQVLVVATAAGMLTVFFDVSYQSYLPVLVPRDQVVEGNSKLQASQSVSQLAGPGLGGLLIKLIGAPWVIAFNAVGYLASATALWRIKHRETPPPVADRRPLATEIGEGLKFVVGHPLLRRLIACTGLGNLTFSVIGALEVLYMVDTLHFSPVTIGIMEMVGAAGGLIAAVLTTKLAKSMGEGLTIIATATVFQLCTFAWPLSSVFAPVPTLMVGSVLLSTSVVAYNISTVSFRQRLCPPALLGRMNASARFLVWGSMPVGAFIGGILGTHLGIVPTLWIASFAGLISLLPIYFSPLWRMFTLPEHVDEAAEGGLTTEVDDDRARVPES